ncbi:MAG: glycosyltransferase family 2 protein [Candidatus Omnitrophota bacterium]
MINQPKIFIVLLNWNGLRYTPACLTSIGAIDYSNYEVIVVDNASTDGSSKVIKKLFPEIVLIENHTNLGYAGGNNVGIRYALKSGADYIFILNNDTLVNREILSVLVAAALNEKNAGSLGCKIVYYEDSSRLQHAGGIITDKSIMHAFNRGEREQDCGQYDTIAQVDYITGAAIFLSRSTIEKVGFFDERFFLYWEDTDFGLRIKNAGLRNIYVPAARVRHKVAASTDNAAHPGIYYYLSRNRLLFAKKHGFVKKRIPKELIMWIMHDIKKLFTHQYYLRITAIVLIIRGAVDSVRGRFGSGPGWFDTPKEEFLEYRLKHYYKVRIKKYLRSLRDFFRNIRCRTHSRP